MPFDVLLLLFKGSVVLPNVSVVVDVLAVCVPNRLSLRCV